MWRRQREARDREQHEGMAVENQRNHFAEREDRVNGGQNVNQSAPVGAGEVREQADDARCKDHESDTGGGADQNMQRPLRVHVFDEEEDPRHVRRPCRQIETMGDELGDDDEREHIESKNQAAAVELHEAAPTASTGSASRCIRLPKRTLDRMSAGSSASKKARTSARKLSCSAV